MVKGLSGFKEWFRGYENNYAVIGGTACDLLLNEASLTFRVTKDIDMVLIVEALSSEFGAKFWEYVKIAGYEHRRKSTSAPEFYRFTKPKSNDYPSMIELFTRRIEGICLPDDAVLTPLPIEDDISSLSAILLDSDYYEFLKSGVIILDGIPILDAARLIPFKARAWLDLSVRRKRGEQIDSKNIRKHKSDILQLYNLLPADLRITLPEVIREDMSAFISENITDNNMQLMHIAKVYGLYIL